MQPVAKPPWPLDHAQIVELKNAGCERTFQEQVSSVAVRPELDAAIDFARDGDTFRACSRRGRRPPAAGRRPAAILSAEPGGGWAAGPRLV